MDTQLLEKHFNKIGARVVVREVEPTWWVSAGIDIREDNHGEFFDIRKDVNEDVGYEVVDLKKDIRHLLLLARRPHLQKEKYLCGFDERHWFVCAVPGKSVSGVISALEALQPEDVQFQINRNLKRTKNRFKRRNEVYLRQGEWFFVPMPNLAATDNFTLQIFKNEPISRGNGSKPHICEEVLRRGGRTVMVCRARPQGMELKAYNALINDSPKARNWNWTPMVRDAEVFARGTVRHPDHKTIRLDGWHQVFMNTENLAPGMQNVVFLD